MSGHEVQTAHVRSGYLRWLASCSCGWSKRCSGLADAEDAADEHDLATDRSLDEPCSCHDTEEYTPERCARHRTEAAV